MGIATRAGAWFTDKMPLNETHMGLIALLFPQATLIHVIRHPLDVMVSAISNHFTHGFYCASALETAARHYVRVRFEDMVSNQEATVRSVLVFIGEPFDPKCLQFHENPAPRTHCQLRASDGTVV